MGNEERTWRIGEIIKLMQDMASYLTPEQIEAMHRRYARARDEMRGGASAGDPAIRRIVDRLDELSELRAPARPAGSRGARAPARSPGHRRVRAGDDQCRVG